MTSRRPSTSISCSGHPSGPRVTSQGFCARRLPRASLSTSSAPPACVFRIFTNPPMSGHNLMYGEGLLLISWTLCQNIESAHSAASASCKRHALPAMQQCLHKERFSCMLSPSSSRMAASYRSQLKLCTYHLHTLIFTPVQGSAVLQRRQAAVRGRADRAVVQERDLPARRAAARAGVHAGRDRALCGP